MKKMISYLIVILASHIVTNTAIAHCPFSFTVYIMDGDHIYNNVLPSSIYHGYPAMPKVLSITPLDGNPQNPNIQFNKDDSWDFSCYMVHYSYPSALLRSVWQLMHLDNTKLLRCHYFTISEDTQGCKNDQYGQATRFQVIIGTQASPPGLGGTPDLRESRPGRNCILTLIAGPNQNLQLDGPVNCTSNFQLKVTDKSNPLNLDMTTGTGEDELQLFPRLDPSSWFRYKKEADFIFYPEFSTLEK